MYSHYTCQSLVLITFRVAITSSDSVKKCSFYLSGRNKYRAGHFSRHRAKNTTFMCLSVKKKKTHLTVHTVGSLKLGFLPCSNLYLKGGMACFGICKTFQHKGWVLPRLQHFSIGFPSSRLPVIHVDLWDMWPHGWTGYWSVVSAPAWAACDQHWCNRVKSPSVLVLSSEKSNKPTLVFFCFVFLLIQLLLIAEATVVMCV